MIEYLNIFDLYMYFTFNEIYKINLLNKNNYNLINNNIYLWKYLCLKKFNIEFWYKLKILENLNDNNFWKILYKKIFIFEKILIKLDIPLWNETNYLNRYNFFYNFLELGNIK